MTLSTDIVTGDPDLPGLLNETRTAVNGKPDTFVELTDTPSSLTSQAGKLLVVNSAGTALQLSEVAASLLRPENEQTDDYTLVLADAAQTVAANKATANTVTIPPNSSVAFPVGIRIPIVQTGAGQTTIAAGAGVTVNSPETLKIAGQWSTVWAWQRATDSWVLSGDIEASA